MKTNTRWLLNLIVALIIIGFVAACAPVAAPVPPTAVPATG